MYTVQSYKDGNYLMPKQKTGPFLSTRQSIGPVISARGTPFPQKRTSRCFFWGGFVAFFREFGTFFRCLSEPGSLLGFGHPPVPLLLPVSYLSWHVWGAI